VLVGEGVLLPRGVAPEDWRFAANDLVRAMSALRLERDLGVNPAGAALAIELVDEMQRLRRRVRVLEGLMRSD
jgi:chaperone modulatory protein CbpM